MRKGCVAAKGFQKITLWKQIAGFFTDSDCWTHSFIYRFLQSKELGYERANDPT